MFDHPVRAAALVRRPEDEIRVWAAALPPGTRARILATSAGVIVTLERVRRGPLPSRRRVVRTLRHQLAAVSHATRPRETAPAAPER